MAKWVLMEWVSESARPKSIYVIVDWDQGARLPALEQEGRWEEVHELEPKLVPDAERAHQAIAKAGYYLIGGQDRYL